MQTDFHDLLLKDLAQVRSKSPLVHNITNQVVTNFVANTLLAVGASPLMAHEISEIEEIISISNSLSINIGTLDISQIESILTAVKFAGEKGIPVVIDPVGAGASKIRTSTALQIIKESKNAVLKGNASEIISLVGNEIKSKGVDSTTGSNNAIESSKTLLKSPGLEAVIITGLDDFIVGKEKVFKCSNGSDLMAKVTGTGCALGSIISAFLFSNEDKEVTLMSAVSYFNIAGELAAHRASGPGTFVPLFIDNLFNLSQEYIQKNIRVQHVE